MSTDNATETPQPPTAVGAQVERGVRPCAYRLRDAEASTHYGRDIFVFFAADEFQENEQARAAIATLAPLYDHAAMNAAVTADRNRIRALVEAVRDANAASQDADDCLIYTPAVQRAWEALMGAFAGPN